MVTRALARCMSRERVAPTNRADSVPCSVAPVCTSSLYRGAHAARKNYRSASMLCRRLARAPGRQRQRRRRQRRIERGGERGLAADEIEPADLEPLTPSLARENEALAGQR